MSVPSLDHKLIGLIYDAAESAAGLRPAIAALAEWLGAEAAHMLLISQGQLCESYFHGCDGSAFACYETDWREQDPRFAAAAANPGRVLSDVDVVAPRAFEASAIYNELLRPAGMRYTLFGNVAATPALLMAQALMRPKRSGPFEAEHIRMLGEALPHLQHAVHLLHLIGGLRQEVDTLRRALDVVPGPVAMLDGTARLLFANAAAEALLCARDGLQLKDQRLTAVRPAEAQRLAAAISSAASFAEGARRFASALPVGTPVRVTRQEGAPLGVLLMPLRPASVLRDRDSTTARVLAVIHEPGATLHLNPELIADLHGLTATESLLACALAQGRTLAEYADERGCSEQTARTHLKRVLDKTETRRQAELVRLLLGSTALHLARAR